MMNPLPEPLALAAATEWKTGAEHLANEAGLTIEIPPHALQLIFSDPVLRKELERLLLTGGDLQPLLLAAEQHALQETDPLSFAALSQGAASAFWDWMKDGFGVVSPSRYASRLQACRTCPFFQPAGQHVLHKVANLLSRPSPVCGKCGCMIHKKAKMVSSHCPAEQADRAGYTLWGDQMEG
jgi:hypothetical protein